MSTTPTPQFLESLAPKFPFPNLTFPAADQRRRTAAAFTRTGLPQDAAATAAALYTTVTNPAHQERDHFTAGERRDSTGVPLPVLRRLRVRVPMIEPNVLSFGRGRTRPGPAPVVTSDPDGVFRVTWDTDTDHHTATHESFTDYLTTHEVVEHVGSGNFRLDTWDDPFLLIPVRHHYQDTGTDITRWMCADGNARLFGFRIALAHDLTRWGITHPWTDPGAYWAADMATVRTVVAAARETVTRLPDPMQEPWPVADRVDQWADLLLPSPEVLLSTVESFLFRDHNL